MTSAPRSVLTLVITLVAAWLAATPAVADIVFTSEPPTTAVVGQPYSYRMTAAEDDDRRRDDDDRGRGGRDDDDDGPGRGRDDDDDDDGPWFQWRIWFIARQLPPWLEFDGDDTIHGTPGQDDIGRHRVRLRARQWGDRADQDFTITVEAVASGPPEVDSDLSASITVAPNPVAVGEPISWRATARNESAVDVANYTLETVFTGNAPFTIDNVDDPYCSTEPRVDATAVMCRWSPLMSGDLESVNIRGTATGAGEIVAVTRVSIVDPVPIDDNSRNDDDRVALRVTDDGSGGGGDGGGGQIPDGEAPVITLNGSSPITVAFGEVYDDPGATALDADDGDLTSEIVVDNPVDTAVIGHYSVTYEVVDRDGHIATATRAVEVVPSAPGGGGGGGAVGSLGVAWLLLLSALARARRWVRPDR